MFRYVSVQQTRNTPDSTPLDLNTTPTVTEVSDLLYEDKGHTMHGLDTIYSDVESFIPDDPWAVELDDDSSGYSYNPRKRPGCYAFEDFDGSENGAQDESEFSRPPSKKSFERPFACPYFKNNPLINSKCSKFRHRTLSQVKKHILRIHIKPLRCGRCKIFKAGNYEQVTNHLGNDDCKKGETLDTYEQDIAQKKTDKIESAATWQEIYAVLFSFNIPSPFWKEEIEVLMAPLENRELLFTLRLFVADHCNKRAYQQGLAEHLRTHLLINRPESEGQIENLLVEYDQYWITKAFEIETSLTGESKYNPDIIIRVRSFPIQPQCS